jgi:hypothetical protein
MIPYLTRTLHEAAADEAQRAGETILTTRRALLSPSELEVDHQLATRVQSILSKEIQRNTTIEADQKQESEEKMLRRIASEDSLYHRHLREWM